ncbi:MAG: competence/damage-inducible protein A [Firmicutes bacterium]|nr:competence/damage-inducible protein A [Bacillota bacterium]
MKTAILTVGTEILFGQIVNTNAAWISQQLQNMGYDVMYHYSVGDNPGRLKELIHFAFHDCDLILTTGGLGPTQDDLTKEVIAEAMGDTIVENKECMEVLMSHFEKHGYKFTPNNLKQAYMPSRATVLPNDAGSAPGFAMEKDGKMIIAMPGPPREMTRMFEKQVKPLLEAKQDSVIYYRLIRTFGLGESMMETELLPLIDGQTDPTIATYAKEGECSLRVASKRPTREEAMAAVDEMTDKVTEIIGKYIYSYDDEDLINVVAKLLLEKNITISSAESCTGGKFAAALCEIPGISAVFERGIVTYSNRAKMEELGVKEETLTAYGAVSPETAEEMVRGLAAKTGSDLCISVTGIAGPGGGSEAKPVGLAYIGLSYKGDVKVVKHMRASSGGRKWTQNSVLLSMLYQVYELIK